MASLRTGAAQFGAPEFSRLAVATAQLAHLCGLPVRAGAAATDVHAVDGRAMAESAEGLSAAVFAGAHFLFQAAGMLSSFNALSLEKYVLDADLITALRAAVDPVRAGEDDLAEDVIDAVGPGGGYLGQAHTRRHGRDHERAGRAAARGVRALGRGRRGRRRRRRPPRPGTPRRARAAGRPRRGHAAAARRVLLWPDFGASAASTGRAQGESVQYRGPACPRRDRARRRGRLSSHVTATSRPSTRTKCATLPSREPEPIVP